MSTQLCNCGKLHLPEYVRADIFSSSCEYRTNFTEASQAASLSALSRIVGNAQFIGEQTWQFAVSGSMLERGTPTAARAHARRCSGRALLGEY